MIVTASANVILALLNLLLIFEVPTLPDSVITVFNSAIGYFAAGLDILNSFIGNTAMGVLGVMLKLVLISNVVYFTISVVFFVLKKIPFLGLEQ